MYFIFYLMLTFPQKKVFLLNINKNTLELSESCNMNDISKFVELMF